MKGTVASVGFWLNPSHLGLDRKNLERICAYMEKTQRDTKLRISWLKMVQHEIAFRSLLYIQGGLDCAKKPIHATFPLSYFLHLPKLIKTKVLMLFFLLF
jgi:hypothetical protein